MLYRSIQEIINNSIKHSKANKLEVEFNWKNNTLYIVVKDNGCGFDYDEILKNSDSGIGLKNLESRLRIIGAGNHVESNSCGTTYFITLGLDENTNEA
jgi:signal transduction histidine kinase